MKKIFSVVLLSLLLSTAAFAQKKYASVSGTVSDSAESEALPYATVSLVQSGQYVLTATDGSFSFSKVAPGPVTLKVEFFGKISQTREFEAVAGKSYTFDFKLENENFRMEEVVVTATRSEAGASTASIISRQAMDHLSASSLSDVMSLLPGASSSSPTLASPASLNLRVLGGTNAAWSMNSLGTSIIVDGAPLSNNSNLQTLAPAMSGSTAGIEAVSPSGGVDARTISTDNIESVEVIRGIPSAQYGDLTSGAILVKSKAGASPLIVRFKTNPNLYQASVSKGFHAGRAGDFNLSADYGYSNKSLVANYLSYRRLNTKVVWTKNFGPINSTTSADFNYNLDRQDQNPDMDIITNHSGAKNLGGRLTTGGHLNFNNAGWLKSVDYNLSGAYTDKQSFHEEEVSNALNLYATSRTEGSIVSNVAGMQVYDAYGGEITLFNGDDASAKATYMPYHYFSHYDIYGKEINAYGKVMANFYGKIGNRADNKTVAGVDFKIDGNLGEGLVYPDDVPPMRNVSNMQSGFRPRHFYDIPFVNQLGFFLQDDFSVSIGKRVLNLSAGARYDNINGMQALAPRTNASFEIIPGVLTLRGGWGVSSKAPTVMYLYPNKAYCDLTLYNNAGSSVRIDGNTVNITPDETLIIAQTHVYDLTNPDLQIARNRKAEIGFDLTIADRYTLAVTAFDENMTNGYAMGQDVSCFKWMQVAPYVAVEGSGGVGTGHRPVLTLGSPISFFFEYYRPQNTAELNTKGIEFELDLGRFDAIRTSFFLNGAYMKSRSCNNGYSFSQNQNSLTDLSYDNNIAVWEPRRVTSCFERTLTALRATHNIPELGFVVTALLQVNWMEKSWNEYYHEDVWTKYLSWEDGKLYDFDPALKDTPEFSYMNLTVTDAARIVEKTQPYTQINLNITKEIGELLTASFYVNNLFNYRPLYANKASTGTYSELGSAISFGFDIKLTIR